jgi:DNA-binding MarR family transcriptional regulator
MRWLTATEQRAWRAFLAATRLLFDSVDAQLQRESGLPHAYYEILVRLSEAPDRQLRMRQLADLSMSSKSRVSHAVARLEERGWVRRAECVGDRRGQLAQLTDTGYAVLAAAAPGHVERVRTALLERAREQAKEQEQACATAPRRASPETVGSRPDR